jgi:uncharacterized membrane protein YphA (DoxX/SURF4 family)
VSYLGVVIGGVAAQLMLAGVFVVAGGKKISDPAPFATTLAAIGLPKRGARWVARLIPSLEIGLAALSLTDNAFRVATAGLAALLVIFTVAVARLHRLSVSCNCFGGSTRFSPKATLARNIALLTVATLLVSRPRSPLGTLWAVSWPLAAVITLASACLVGWLLARAGSAADDRRVIRRVTALKYLGPDLNGTTGSGGQLAHFVRPGRRLLVVFVRPGCPACEELEPELAGWARGEPSHTGVAVVRYVVDGSATDARRLPGPTVVEPDNGLALAMSLPGTPSAVLVDPSGARVSSPFVGSAAIRAVMRNLLADAPDRQQASSATSASRAQAVSRRGFLGFMAVAWLVAACKKDQPKPPASRPRAPIIPVPGNEIDDDCSSISRYREIVGVQDKDGNGHPGYSGWTDVTFSYTYDPPTKRISSKLRCNCTDKNYSSIEECQKECKASLGCFTGICEPVNHVCISVASSGVRFKATTESYRLQWKPKGKLSSKCQIEKSSWERRIEEHEGRHVADAQALAEDATRAWQTTYEECAMTEDAAANAVRNKLEADLKAKLKELEKQNVERAEQWHKTTEGQPIIDPDCSQCG